MMFQTEIEWSVVIVSLIIFGIFIFLMSMFLIIEYISIKIHKSYHKGYNQATNDKVAYYSNLHDLSESFNDIYQTIEVDGLNFPLELSERLISYKELLKEYRER